MWDDRGCKKHSFRVSILILVTCIALLGTLATLGCKKQKLGKNYREQLEAAHIMQTSLKILEKYRLQLGIPIDHKLDPNSTGIIGMDLTPLTTTVGNLEAKRTATNPAFAALMARYFYDLKLHKGDVIAIGASGSFPGLILATMAAARVLKLKPIFVYSMGSSMYGANIPGFTFVEMLKKLNREEILPYQPVAVSPGGEGDTGRNFLDRKGALNKAAKGSQIYLINEKSVEASIKARLSIYRKYSCCRPIRCFINIGGADPNYGTTAASLKFPNGLVVRAPIAKSVSERGLIFEYASMGVPVINLIDLRDLAIRNGVAVDPIPMPIDKNNGVYNDVKYSRVLVLLTIITVLIILGFEFLHSNSTFPP